MNRRHFLTSAVSFTASGMLGPADGQEQDPFHGLKETVVKLPEAYLQLTTSKLVETWLKEKRALRAKQPPPPEETVRVRSLDVEIFRRMAQAVETEISLLTHNRAVDLIFKIQPMTTVGDLLLPAGRNGGFRIVAEISAFYKYLRNLFDSEEAYSFLVGLGLTGQIEPGMPLGKSVRCSWNIFRGYPDYIASYQVVWLEDKRREFQLLKEAPRSPEPVKPATVGGRIALNSHFIAPC